MNQEDNKKLITLPEIILYVVLFLVGSVILLKLGSYTTYYSGESILEVINMMTNDLAGYPFYFPAGFFTPSGLSLCLVLLLIEMFAITLNITRLKADRHFKQGAEEGTSAWLTEKDPKLTKWANKYVDPADVTNMIFTWEIKMTMNTRKTLRNNNVLVIGGSGAGKSRFFVKPNLCEMPLNCSFICTDPSGELLKEAGAMLAGAGYKIKVFNLVNMKLSDKYNPLDYINTENDVLQLVDCILENTSDPNHSGGDDFWEKAQKLMLQAFIFLIWEFGDVLHIQKNLTGVVDLMTGCEISEEESSEQGGITAQYFQAIESQGWHFDENGKFHLGVDRTNPMVKNYEPLDPKVAANDIALKQYKKFMTGAGKTLKSILISAEARLSTLDSPDIAQLLEADTIKLNEMGDVKSALFIIIPSASGSFNFLAAMMYTQLFQSLYYHAENECQGNYLVNDANGERVRNFAISHVAKIEYEEETEETDWDGEIPTEVEEVEEIKPDTNKKKDKKKKGNNKEEAQKLEGNKTEQEKDDEIFENALDKPVDDNEANMPDDSPGDVDDSEVEAKANAFIENCKKAKITKVGTKHIKYRVKVPAIDGESEDFLVAEYENPKFAKNKLEALKNCSVKRCGLYLPYHVRFLLDEFANIGKIPDFTKKLATMRKYEISATVIVQNMSQLKTMYKDDWGSIIGNCDSFLFLGGQEMDTLEYIEKILGKRTIRTKSTSRTVGKSQNESFGPKGRSLMDISELGRMKNSQCIFKLRGEQPYIGDKYKFEKHPNYQYTSDFDINNVYTFRPKKPETEVDKAKLQVEADEKYFSSSSPALPHVEPTQVSSSAQARQNIAAPKKSLMESSRNNARTARGKAIEAGVSSTGAKAIKYGQEALDEIANAGRQINAYGTIDSIQGYDESEPTSNASASSSSFGHLNTSSN